jgi:CubicO group peptidase (beta-lactamase class C family)
MMLVNAFVMSALLQAAPSVEARVDTLVVGQMRARKIPGAAVAVLRDNRLVFAKGYGEANAEWHTPVTPETVFLLASMTKSSGSARGIPGRRSTIGFRSTQAAA